MTSYGEIRREAVYLLSAGRALRLPTPPPFHNKGNHVFSLSRLARYLGEQAEELGVTLLPETDAAAPARGRRRRARRAHRATRAAAVRARARRLRAGSGDHRPGDGARRRRPGDPDGAAIDRFGLAGDNPQVYALGVKEVWKVPKPLDRVIHTLGWPLRAAREVPGVRRLVRSTRWATTRSASASSSGWTTADATLSVHDLLQRVQDPPPHARDPRRRRARRLGRQGASPRAASGRSRRASRCPAPCSPATPRASSTCPG